MKGIYPRKNWRNEMRKYPFTTLVIATCCSKLVLFSSDGKRGSNSTQRLRVETVFLDHCLCEENERLVAVETEAPIRFDERALLRIGCFAAYKGRSRIAVQCIEGFEELC